MNSERGEVLVVTGGDDGLKLVANLAAEGIKGWAYPEHGDLDKIEFVVIWGDVPDLLGELPNLKAVQGLGMGVEKILQSGQVPGHVPVLRARDALMTSEVTTWVIWAVLECHRQCGDFATHQAARRWSVETRHPAKDSRSVRVGIMGLGDTGSSVADSLAQLGFQVHAWVRNSRPECKYPLYAGRDRLRDFANQTDILVCLLPLTAETTGILNAELISWLPRGAHLINAGRGGQQVEEAIIDALEDGHLGTVILDVQQQEPLPASSPLWDAPRLRIFPHCASGNPSVGVLPQFLENRRAILEGRPLRPGIVVDRVAGY